MKIKIIDQIASDESDTRASNLLSRDGLFGDAFFTTGIIEENQITHRESHIQRLVLSARKLLFPELDLQALNDQLDLIESQYKDAVFRLSVGRAQLERGYAISAQQQVLCTLVISPWVDKPAEDCQAFFAETPVSINPKLAGIKHSNRLDSVLAASECGKTNQEAIMCADELVICGSRTNLFCFYADQWITPCLKSAGISGITRQRILDKAKLLKVEIEERPITRQELMECSAAFVTNSLVGIWPIEYLENKKLDTKMCHQLESKLNFYR